MAPSPCINLNGQERELLLDIARRAIQHLPDSSQPLTVDLQQLPASLHQPLAVFVTLTIESRLRGCIGSLQASEPLANAVADAAQGAAFRDPRFPDLTRQESARVVIDISVLSAMEPVAAASSTELLATLRPGVDGLLLATGEQSATFLPKVWEQLPQPDNFLQQLMLKAGLPADYWSDRLEFHRYQALCFDDGPPGRP